MSLPIIGKIITAIGDMVKTVFSGEEREKRLRVHINKRRLVALNLAEEMFLLAEEIFILKPSKVKKSKLKRWKSLKRKFNRLD